MIAISDEESFLTARRVSRTEGILIGGSGGLAVAAAIKVARSADPDDDRRRAQPRLRSRLPLAVFDDDWMANYGFLIECEQCVGAVLDARSPTIESLLYVNPSDTVRVADRPHARQRHQPVAGLQEHSPFAAAEVAGSVDELELMEAIARDSSVMGTAVEDVMGPPLPTIGIGQQLELALEMLHTAPALLVLSGGRPLSVLTRTDILAFFEAQAQG